MSAASLLETAIVIEARYGEPGGNELDQLLQKAQIKIEPVTVEQAEVARRAYRSYGKGRHPAGLNFGDCFSYALAKVLGEALLFKGDDFSKTDIANSYDITNRN
jgi:ribonuclease VapC